MGARPSGRFSVIEPTRLEFSESCGRSDSEAASTPRSDTDNLWMHGGMALSQFFDPAQHGRAIGVPTSKSVELLLEAAGVIGLCIGVAQFLQLGRRLVVGRSNFLIHERVEPCPYGVGALHDGVKMLLTQL